MRKGEYIGQRNINFSKRLDIYRVFFRVDGG